MTVRKYDPKIKQKAINRYLKGETAKSIAKDFRLPSLNLVMKWAERYVKQHDKSVNEYRRFYLCEEEVINSMQLYKSMRQDIQHAMKAHKFLESGDVENALEALRKIPT